jgi:hypothetical protein
VNFPPDKHLEAVPVKGKWRITGVVNAGDARAGWSAVLDPATGTLEYYIDGWWLPMLKVNPWEEAIHRPTLPYELRRYLLATVRHNAQEDADEK